MLEMPSREWKPGPKTSEFWITVFALIIGAGAIGLVVMMGKTWWSHALGGAVGIAALLKAHGYTVARTQLKKLWVEYMQSENQPPPPPPPAPVIIPPTPPVNDTPIPICNPVLTSPPQIIQKPQVITITTKTVKGGGTVTTVRLSDSDV